MATSNPDFVREEIMRNPEFAKIVSNPVKVHDKYGKFNRYESLTYPIRYTLTEEDIKLGTQVHEKNKKEFISKIKNELVLIKMGADYTDEYAQVPGDIRNHRVRAYVMNPEGERFFIEFSSGVDRSEMLVTGMCDIDLKKHFDDGLESTLNQIKSRYGKAWPHSDHGLMRQRDHSLQQPYYWYKKEYWHNRKWPFTSNKILMVVNNLFDCKFKEVIVDGLYVDYGTYSVSPNQ